MCLLLFSPKLAKFIIEDIKMVMTQMLSAFHVHHKHTLNELNQKEAQITQMRISLFLVYLQLLACVCVCNNKIEYVQKRPSI